VLAAAPGWLRIQRRNPNPVNHRAAAARVTVTEESTREHARGEKIMGTATARPLA